MCPCRKKNSSVRFWAFVKDRTLKTVWWITSILLVCGKQCHRVKCYVRYQNENENIADPVHNASKGRIIFNWATVSACFWREWYWTVSRFNRAYYINKLAFSFCLLLVGCYFSKFPLSASHFAAFFWRHHLPFCCWVVRPTAAITSRPERRSAPGIWSSSPGPYYTSPATATLTTGQAASEVQAGCSDV